MAGGAPSLQAGRDAARSGRFEAARRAFEAAADLGDAEGLYELGLLHRDGRGLPKSMERALALFRAAANAGLAEAQYELAVSLAETDKAEAERWLARAAKEGHAAAMTRLADLFGERDPQAARELLARAAQQGHRPAMIGYGHVLTAGMGGPLDRVEGLAWLFAAGSLAMDRVIEEDIQALAGALSQREIATAQKRGRAILRRAAPRATESGRLASFSFGAWFGERPRRSARSSRPPPLTRSPAGA